jgi:hypothetical protein
MSAPAVRTQSEVVVSVLASDSLLQQIIHDGALPVLADIDPQSGGLSRASLEAQISTSTRRVVVEPDHEAFAPFASLAAATEPRGILLLTTHTAPSNWRPIAPGLRGWGPNLVEVNENLLIGGVPAVIGVLQSLSVPAQPYPRDLAFARPGSTLRGRRRDFPGAESWRHKMLVLSAWANYLPALTEAAAQLARQLSFDFDPPRRPASADLLPGSVVAAA